MLDTQFNTKQAVTDSVSDRIADFIKRFIRLPHDSLYRLLGTWVMQTYMYQDFDFAPYLLIYSPEKHSGKSTLLEILQGLSYNASDIHINATEAVLFRTAEGRTHFLDEIDAWAGKDYCRGVLNAGFKQGGCVIRMKPKEPPETGYEEERFAVFAPRALAGIGADVLADTTRDRTFAIKMERQKRPARYRAKFVQAELTELRQCIESFVAANRELISIIYESGEFYYLKRFSNRTVDITEGLAAILEFDNPSAIEEFCEAVRITRSESSEDKRKREVISTLIALASIDELLTKDTDGEKKLIGNSSELAEWSTDYTEEPLQASAISSLLNRHEIRSKSTRINGGKPLYRYRLSLSELQDIYERYYA